MTNELIIKQSTVLLTFSNSDLTIPLDKSVYNYLDTVLSNANHSYFSFSDKDNDNSYGLVKNSLEILRKRKRDFIEEFKIYAQEEEDSEPLLAFLDAHTSVPRFIAEACESAGCLEELINYYEHEDDKVAKFCFSHNRSLAQQLMPDLEFNKELLTFTFNDNQYILVSVD